MILSIIFYFLCAHTKFFFLLLIWFCVNFIINPATRTQKGSRVGILLSPTVALFPRLTWSNHIYMKCFSFTLNATIPLSQKSRRDIEKLNYITKSRIIQLVFYDHQKALSHLGHCSRSKRNNS